MERIAFGTHLFPAVNQMIRLVKSRHPKPRILVMAHAHPDFSLGGGELAAYNLFKAYRQLPAVEDAWFLGRADRSRGPNGKISVRRENEYLWEQGVHDWHMMKAVHQASLVTWFADLIKSLKPTVIHTHHYAHLGLEYLRVIKQVDPGIRIYMTLHEYMAICSNNGQMIKANSMRLCSRESPDDCRQCFPHKTAEDFWLRKHTFLNHFKLVDGFIAPSEFLRDRYIAWGLRPEQIVVIENGQADDAPLEPRTLRKGESRNRFAYFGQINPYKGLNVVLKALHDMPKDERKKLVLEVHGANLEQQPAEFQKQVEDLRNPLIDEGVVQWFGPYQPHELRSRMANIDWVIVPSVWWENSPMVIQEAYVAGRPVIASDIGGMAEKVTPLRGGLNVRAGSSLEWAKAFQISTLRDSEWDRLVKNIKPCLSHAACAKGHVSLFRG